MTWEELERVPLGTKSSEVDRVPTVRRGVSAYGGSSIVVGGR
jgi:hypothetical protein